MLLLLLANWLTVFKNDTTENFGQITAGGPNTVPLPPTTYVLDNVIQGSALQAAQQAQVLAARAEAMEIILAAYAAQKALQTGAAAAAQRTLSSTTGSNAGIPQGISSNIAAELTAQSNALAGFGLTGMGSSSGSIQMALGPSTNNIPGASPTGTTANPGPNAANLFVN